jgi:hypothetical protein
VKGRAESRSCASNGPVEVCRIQERLYRGEIKPAVVARKPWPLTLKQKSVAILDLLVCRVRAVAVGGFCACVAGWLLLAVAVVAN